MTKEIAAPLIIFIAIGGGILYMTMFVGGDGAHGLVMTQLRECPAAQEVLGDDIRLAIGPLFGTSEVDGAYGRSSWRYTVRGDDARGRYEWAARKEGGPWMIDQAQLTVDNVVIDVRGCQQGVPPSLAPGPTMVPAAAAKQ